MKTNFGTAHQCPDRRRIRVFSFDPSLGLQLDTAELNEMTLEVLWEIDRETGTSCLKPGPIGEYVEVVDYDPASGVFYEPVDLNDGHLLAQDGLSPAEGNPQFHQQMVYAVAMATIEKFEDALGRVAMWAPRVVRDQSGRATRTEFVQRLRIYPHAIREANAYYSPQKKSLLFGYFPTRGGDRTQLPGGMVFTCLSHDVIAHETTHALLDGLHPRFTEATNLDVHALHEAFADIVALFSRFSHPEVLESQIALTRGDLERQNMLGQLAQQFGRSLGKRSALRDAIGSIDDETGEWHRNEPDPSLLDKTHEPHDRGGILVAAIFDAFLSIYRSRSADLFRIASNGTGILPEGEIHPDLVKRLAIEAARSADGVLRMCIRALDYVPPVDVTFGDYFRGIITADLDIHPEDKFNYRIAFVEAFRQWGIFPEGIRSLSVASLCYPRLDIPTSDRDSLKNSSSTKRKMKSMQRAASELFRTPSKLLLDAKQTKNTTRSVSLHDHAASELKPEDNLAFEWDLGGDREVIYESMKCNAKLFHRWLTKSGFRKMVGELGLTLKENPPNSVYRTWDGKTPSIEIHSVRSAQRRGARGQIKTDLVVEVCQRRRGYFDPVEQKRVDRHSQGLNRNEPGDFRFRRGCTLIIDTSTHKIRYVISNRGNILDNNELERVRRFLTGEGSDPVNAFHAMSYPSDPHDEEFAALHRR